MIQGRVRMCNRRAGEKWMYLATVTEARVASDCVVGHVAAEALARVGHVAVGREVACVAVDQLPVQIAADAILWRPTPIDGIIDDEQLPWATHHRAAVANLDEDGPLALFASRTKTC